MIYICDQCPKRLCPKTLKKESRSFLNIKISENLLQISEESGLKRKIKKKKKDHAYSPMTSWQTEGEKVDTVTHFIFLGSKITVDSN